MINTDPNEQVISKYDLAAFNKGEKDTKVHRIWEKIISSFPVKLKKEAEEKGFKLKKLDELMGLINFTIEPNNPSVDLEKAFSDHLLFIICVND